MSQSLTFDSAVSMLYFGVKIKEASNSLVDTFLTVHQLHHHDRIARQSNLNVYLELETDKEAWSSRHTFTFTKSPIQDLKIDSGYIYVTIGEAPNIKKLLDVRWCVEFANKNDATLFFKKIKQIFELVSTVKKYGYDKMNNGYFAEFATRKPTDRGIRDITFFLGQSLDRKKFQITLILISEFTK